MFRNSQQTTLYLILSLFLILKLLCQSIGRGRLVISFPAEVQIGVNWLLARLLDEIKGIISMLYYIIYNIYFYIYV